MGRYLDLFDQLTNLDGAREGVTTKTTETTKANVKENSLPKSTTHGHLWSFMSYDGTRSGVGEALVAVEAFEGVYAPPSRAVAETTKRGHPTGVEASTDGFGLAVSSWDDAEHERAPIVKSDGNIPRAWAEGFVRLHPDRPPGDVPGGRWLRFVSDVGLFLYSPFCASAAALGWGPRDLFGCDRDRPYARIDRAGLLWLLGAGRIVALTANTATIELPTGSRWIWRRRAHERGRVLPWELVS